MNFEEELSKGNFLISTCKKCNLTVWPPNDICSKCFGNVSWKKCSKVGYVLEWSQKDENFFCVAEFDKGVRIIGTLLENTPPKIHQKIMLAKARISDSNYHFEFKSIDA